ncbi:hypothetical protein [Zongyangia hominis]|uniref:Ada DNA repair metal-binding domain-containing protein n=1 Tax=Zongyangia hominis TaxID=2763677 RepID=A0A926EBZ3_9FIRM|nr:hypothetical protein [Zongyangia hominis]MBC8569439.1 hypothetical protein [Zongyangia hominis]
MSSYPTPLYQRTWFVVLMLFLFAPVGIYLTWKYGKGGKILKSTASAFFGFVFLTVLISCFTPGKAPVNADRITAQSMSQSESQPKQTRTVTTTPKRMTAPVKTTTPVTSTTTTPVTTSSTSATTTTKAAATPSAQTVSSSSQPKSGGGAAQTPTPAQGGGTKSSYTLPPAEAPQSGMVWIPTNGGTKYHSNPNCSGMDGPRQVTVEEAESLGFTPCKKCY